MTRDDMKVWVLAALRSLGGKAWMGDVAEVHLAHLRSRAASIWTDALYVAIRRSLGSYVTS